MESLLDSFSCIIDEIVDLVAIVVQDIQGLIEHHFEWQELVIINIIMKTVLLYSLLNNNYSEELDECTFM